MTTLTWQSHVNAEKKEPATATSDMEVQKDNLQ